LSNFDIHEKTRAITTTYTVYYKLDLGQKGILYSGSRIYNQLPTHIKPFPMISNILNPN
jgi:hypothetical protein